MDIPKTMLSARQNASGENLYIDEVPVPTPAHGEVLVKIHCSPINPSDLSFLQGTYADKPLYPASPGIEACGTVVASGGGILPFLRMGKRVSCSSAGKGGTWAEYMVTSAMRCVPVVDKLSDEQASMLIVNPMTALAFIDIAKKERHSAIIQTAAAGALGKMMVHLCKQNGIELINLVRSQANRQSLLAIGAQHVLCSSDVDFVDEFRAISKQLHATLAIDSVGGDMTALILSALPQGSKILAYAKLSEEHSKVDARMLIQKNISIQGFYLSHWTSEQSIPKMLRTLKKAQNFLINAHPVEVQKTVSLYDIQEGINLYKHQMGAGKVIVSMSGLSSFKK